MVRVFKVAFAATVCLCANTAMAVPQYFMVGDLDDPRCQFATIEQALQAAAANGPDLDYVMVSNSMTYAGQALRVGNQSVLIQGGYANCDLDADEAQPYADLVGNSSDPVIRIEPTSPGNYEVRLSGLRLRGGGRPTLNGGGVRLQTATGANVTLLIERTEISGNRADSGGGLHAERNGSPAGTFSLTLNPGTRIRSNTAAGSGGGINLWGGNTFIAADDVRIDENSAAAAGGGIAALSGTFIGVGNPDIDQWPSRRDVTGARVENNTAGTSGGGIYLFGNATTMEARELIVDGNRTEFSGGGIALSGGATMTFMREATNAFGWYCPSALECTRISNNQVANGIVTGALGGALAVFGNSSAYLIQTLVRDNRAQDGAAIYTNGNGIVQTEGSVFSANRSYDPTGDVSAIIRTGYTPPAAPPRLQIAYSTFVGNQRRAGDNSLQPGLILPAPNTDLRVFSSVLLDGNVIMSTAGISDCVVLGPDSGLPAGNNTRLSFASQNADRIFLSPTRSDWRPRFDSPLTDVCDTQAYTPDFRDRDLQLRCRDDAKPNQWGACDIGAWENDQLFANGFDS